VTISDDDNTINTADDAAEPQTAPLGAGFAKLWTASTLSNLADGVLKIALPLAALRLTDSPMLLGGLGMALALPWLILALPIGAMADRADRRNVMLVGNAARAVVASLVAATFVGGFANIWLLYVAAFLIGTSEVAYDTTAQSILPQVVDKAGLERANARLYGVEIVANNFVGPPLGGALMGVAVALALGVPAAIWVVAFWVLWTLRGNFRPGRSDDAASPATPRQSVIGTLRSDIAQGLRFLFGHKVLRTLAIMTGMTNLAGAAAGAIVVLFAVGEDSPMGLTEGQFGFMATATAVGAVVGSLVASRAAKALGRALTLGLAAATFAVYVATPIFTTNVWIIFAAMSVSGLGVMMWNVIAVSLRQALAPEEMLGRVNSCYRLLAWGSMPLGALIGGALGEAFGLRAVFIFSTAVAAGTMLGMFVVTNANIEAAEAGASDEPGRVA
jgi:MFS family permease